MKKSITQKSERVGNENQSITREFVRSLSAGEVQNVVGGCPGHGNHDGSGPGPGNGTGGGGGR